jgi:hypothetical protein
VASVERHSFTAALPNGTTVAVEDGSLTFDENLAPFDPRLNPPPRVTLTMRTDWYDADPVSKLTAQFSGKVVADLSAQFGNGLVSTITEFYVRKFNPGYDREPLIRTASLMIRSRSINPDGSMDLELTSDDALLQDYSQFQFAPQYVNGPPRLRLLAPWLVNIVLPGAQWSEIEADKDIAGMTDPATGYIPFTQGMNALSYIESPVQAAGARIWCDELGYWHLAPSPKNHNTASSITALTDYSDSVSRDGDWYNALTIEATYTADLGAGEQTYSDRTSVNIGSGPYRTYVETRDYGTGRPPPLGEMASYIVSRLYLMGRSVTVSAVSDYSISPGHSLTVTFPNSTTITGHVGAVAWDFSSREMSVRVRFD